MEQLPRVEPFYAVKCNPTSQVVEYISKLPGMGFDCASTSELSLALNLEVPKDKIIFANPYKGLSHLKFARDHGVRMMTFDSESELIKIRSVYPEAELVIRIMVEEFGSVCSFKEKFGATLKDAEKLISLAHSLSLNVIGISFHVGSGCKNPNAYYHAIKNSKQLFDYAKYHLGTNFKLLDLGGGFTDLENYEGESLFEKISSTIKEALDEYFPESSFPEGELRIIAEPGRYFVQSVFTLAISVSGKKLLSNGNQVISGDQDSQTDKIMYYVNEGLYSAFNCVIFDHKIPQAAAVYTGSKFVEIDDNLESVYKSVLWGPTCDGFDCVSRDIELPQLEVGDWIIFDDFGAYTMAAGSNFNGFAQSKIYWVN